MDDFDRPLNERGRNAAPLIGEYLATQNLVPDIVLCSAAARTQETLTLIMQHLAPAPTVETMQELYLSAPATMLSAVHKINHADHVMIIAHNPGLHVLALDLIDADNSSIDLISLLAQKFPTAALASFSFAVRSFADISPGTGRLTHFETPKSLT